MTHNRDQFQYPVSLSPKSFLPNLSCLMAQSLALFLGPNLWPSSSSAQTCTSFLPHPLFVVLDIYSSGSNSTCLDYHSYLASFDPVLFPTPQIAPACTLSATLNFWMLYFLISLEPISCLILR